MKKILNIALFLSFAATVLMPLTGIHIHKMASVIYLHPPLKLLEKASVHPVHCRNRHNMLCRNILQML